jgi:hypothetical protein
MTQALYAHMNKKIIIKKKELFHGEIFTSGFSFFSFFHCVLYFHWLCAKVDKPLFLNDQYLVLILKISFFCSVA